MGMAHFYMPKSIPIFWLYITIIIIIIIIRLLASFLWSLTDGKSPQVSSIFLSILADFNTAVILMVSILLPVFSPSICRPFHVHQLHWYNRHSHVPLALSAGTVEYTDCTSTKGLNCPNDCPRGPVCWDCKTHRLNLHRTVRLPYLVSWI